MNNEELKDKIGNTFLKLYQTKYITDIEDLCQGENKVLMYLYAADGEPVYPSDIAKALMISKQRVTSVLNAMQKKGFCTLEHSTDDRRKIQVKITHTGEKNLEKKQSVVQGYFDIFIEEIGMDKISEMCDGLEKAVNLLIEKEQNGGIQ